MHYERKMKTRIEGEDNTKCDVDAVFTLGWGGAVIVDLERPGWNPGPASGAAVKQERQHQLGDDRRNSVSHGGDSLEDDQRGTRHHVWPASQTEIKQGSKLSCRKEVFIPMARGRFGVLASKGAPPVVDASASLAKSFQG